LRIEPLEDESWVIHRKVMSLSKPQKMTFILFVKADSFKKISDSLKVILTEQTTEYEETFMYDTKTILTKEEFAVLASALQEGDKRKVIDQIVKVVEGRLKIRTIKEDLQLVESKDPVRYSPYFLEVSASQPLDVSAIRQDPKFDIRNGFRFSLIEPEKGLPEPPQIPQEL